MTGNLSYKEITTNCELIDYIENNWCREEIWADTEYDGLYFFCGWFYSNDGELPNYIQFKVVI